MDFVSAVWVLASMAGLIVVPGAVLAYGILPKPYSTLEFVGVALVLGHIPYYLVLFLNRNLMMPVTASLLTVMVVLTIVAGILTFARRNHTAPKPTT